MTVAVLAVVAAVGVSTVASWRLWKTLREGRLARLQSDAEPSLVALRQWKTKVEAGLKKSAVEGRWLSRDTRHDWETSCPAPTKSVRALARHSGIGDEAKELIAFAAQDLATTVKMTNDRVREIEVIDQRSFFDTIEKQPLTDEQALAVLTFDNRVQVIAAAGSGKTSVMVARAAYAIRRRFIPASRILLLAFNKDAATELQERVEARLGAAGIDATGLKAATFHSFGLTVIGRATGRKPRLAPWLDGGGDIETISRIVDELRDRSLSFRFRWDIYRLLFARMSDEPDGGDPDSYDHEARNTGFKTANGETVKSQGERMIADFLYFSGIKYEYEKAYPYDVADAEHSQYRPDFYYPDIDIWHEHWALDRDGNPPAEFKGYATGIAWKKDVHRQHGTTLIETTWAQILDRSGFGPLAEDLKSRGLEIDWNPDRPVVGTKPIDHKDLARLMRSFMTHAKSNSLTPADLAQRLSDAPKSIQKFRTQQFLDLYWEIHDAWQSRLAEDDSIDFEDMLVLAAEHLEAGKTDMGYDLVLVDEFQDASQARARLTKALIDQPHRYLLAVGDDWQSINRFAGADLSVMTSFNEWFGEGPTLRLEKTFRSPQSICDTASGFVAKNPRQLKKEVTSIQDHYGEAPSLVRVRNVSEVTEAISGVLDSLAGAVRSTAVAQGPSGAITVDILGRYNFDRTHVPRHTPAELKVRFRTVHASKGLEADYIIVPNVASGTYGFPSEIIDDPVLSLAMAEADPFPHAEERRLLYVALTRARRHVTLIGVQGQESSFIAELLLDRRLELSPLSTAGFSEPCPKCRRGILVSRSRRSDGGEFMACNTFPRCNFTRSF